MEKVVLVDVKNKVIGAMLKSEVHSSETPLHRGFSIFIFNPETGKLLLQQRSHLKKTFPLIWSNSCCGHPMPGENTTDAAKRRLADELGLDKCEIMEAIKDYHYKAEMGGIVENEFCPILIGFTEEIPKINKSEVEAVLWTTWQDFKNKINEFPKLYSQWSIEEAELLDKSEKFWSLVKSKVKTNLDDKL